MDLKDNNHPYNVGDTYPRKGLEVSAERIAELSGNDNNHGCPIIEKVEEPEKKAPAKKPVKKTAAE
jgi:hypothetical protein